MQTKEELDRSERAWESRWEQEYEEYLDKLWVTGSNPVGETKFYREASWEQEYEEYLESLDEEDEKDYNDEDDEE